MVMKENIVGNRASFIKLGVLFKQGYGHFFIDPAGAAIGCFFTGQYPQQGTFATAITGYQRNFVTFFNVKVNILKQWFYAKRLGERFYGYIMHGANIENSWQLAVGS